SPVHGKTTTIDHDGRTVFRDVPAPLTVGRYHSLVVEERTLPPVFEISARTTGVHAGGAPGGVVMAIRHRELPAEGVQFHPEAGLDAIVAALGPADRYYVQPPPGATDIEAWLAARGLSTNWTWAKVMRGTEPPPTIPTNLEVRELTPGEADRFGAVVSTAFG